jgi:hypothetical protein
LVSQLIAADHTGEASAREVRHPAQRSMARSLFPLIPSEAAGVPMQATATTDVLPVSGRSETAK